MPDGITADPVEPVFSTTVVVSTTANAHDEPLYTFNRLATVLKYRSPAVNALPSLSSVGSLEKAPRYTSVNWSSAASAAACAVCAAVALLAALVADVLADDALLAALVADVDALLADVLAELAELAALVAEVDAELAELLALVA